MEGSEDQGRKPGLKKLGCLRRDSGQGLLKGSGEDWVRGCVVKQTLNTTWGTRRNMQKVRSCLGGGYNKGPV